MCVFGVRGVIRYIRINSGLQRERNANFKNQNTSMILQVPGVSKQKQQLAVNNIIHVG